MKHLKKYSELEEINEVSRELAKRAAQKAIDKYDDDFNKDTDNSGGYLYRHKLSNQYSLFKNYKEDQDFFNNVKEKINKLGFILEKETDNKRKVTFYYILNNQNKKYILIREDGYYNFCGHFKPSWITESEQRKLHTCVKLVQKFLKKELLNPNLEEFLKKDISNAYHDIEYIYLNPSLGYFLKRIGIETISDLIQCKYDELCKFTEFNNFKFKYLNSIEKILSPYKLKIDMDLN